MNKNKGIPEVLSSGDEEKQYSRNIWDKDGHGPPSNNNIDRILDFPPITDMAGVLSRAHFKNKEQRLGAVYLAHFNRKFKDNNHQEMLRDFCASTLGDGALGKVLQIQASTNLLDSTMTRAALGMPKTKIPDQVHGNNNLRAETGREINLEDRRG